jgi:hypothetical protein
VSFRELKAQIYWPATDQKVQGLNLCGRTAYDTQMHLIKLKVFLFRILRKLLPSVWRFKSKNDYSSLRNNLQERLILLKTGTTWDTYQLKIYSEIERLGISRFRLSPTVIGTMDPPIPYLIDNVLALNSNDRAYLKKLAKNYIRVGGGKRGTVYYCASDSRIHKILTLFELKSELNKFYNSNMKISGMGPLEIVEFGGGIGQMAELVIRELNPKTYTIIDLPIVSTLAEYYLDQQNLNYKINFIGAEDELLLLDKSTKVFISSWAISEISLDARKRIEKYMEKMDYLFIEVQDYFDGIDNYGWITTFLVRNPQFISTSTRSDRTKRSRLYKIQRI